MFRYSLFRLTRQGAALEGEKSAIYDCPVLPYAHGSSRGMPSTELLAASATDVPRRPKTLIPASLASAADPRPYVGRNTMPRTLSTPGKERVVTQHKTDRSMRKQLRGVA